MKSVIFLFLTILNSIIPTVEKFEQIENLPQKKYSNNQFTEIVHALSIEHPIRIATYNMLFDIYDENLDPVNRWPQRLPRIVELLNGMQADVVGIQELLSHQLDQLLPRLAAYNFHQSILFNKERFELVEGMMWDLSGSSLVMVQLKDRKTGTQFAVFNIHLAFGNVDKREAQVREALSIVQTCSKGMPVLLMGDMNTFPNRPDLEKLPFLDGTYLQRLFTKVLQESENVSLLGHVGPISTFTNDGESIIPFMGVGTPGVMLDHIYVNEQVTVLIHATECGRVDGHFPSDHMPVLIDIIF